MSTFSSTVFIHMPFIEDFNPERGPERPVPSYDEAAQNISRQLLQSFRYARLTEQDIQKAGELGQEADLTQYVAHILDFHESIIPDAFRWMEERLPKTIESSVSHHLGMDHLFTPDEERTLRMEALREIPRQEVEHDKAVYDLTAKILSYASPVRFGDDLSGDPESFSKLSDIEILHRQLPQLIKRESESLWAIRIPQMLSEEQGRSDFYDSVGSYLVVGDIDASEMLSAEVYSNDVLLKFFLEQEMRNRQKALMDVLRDRLSEIAKNKFERIGARVEQVNNLLRQTLLQHLIRDVQRSGPLQFVDFYRDDRDVKALETGIPRSSSTGRESNLTVFHMREPSAESGRPPENSLEFTWEYPFRKRDGSIEHGKAFVMVNNGSLWYSNGDFGHWEKTPDWGAEKRDMKRLRDLFEGIQLTTIEEWLDDRETAHANTLQRASLIRSTGSSAELLKMQQDYGFSGYPTHERFIVPENIHVDVTDEAPPPLMEGGFSLG